LFSDDPRHRDDGSQHVEEDRRDWQEMTSLTGTPTEQRRQFAELVLSRPPAVTPKTKFLYSNAGYGIAGAMLEKVTGESWESLLERRLFQPLGIRATFDWPATDDPEQPWGHFKSRSGPQPHDPHDAYHLPACLAPAGGVSMSAEDYARFLRLHLQGLDGRDGLLRAKTIQHLHSRPAGTDPNAQSFGYGWASVPYEGNISSWFEGSAGTFYAGAVMLPSKDLAAAVFTNAGIRQTGAGGVEMLKWATHHYRASGTVQGLSAGRDPGRADHQPGLDAAVLSGGRFDHG
jgi:D-alanyl-D-alanine carboxypeptidase